MMRKLVFVILPFVVFVGVLFYVPPENRPRCAAMAGLLTTIWVVTAMFAREPDAAALDKHLPPVVIGPGVPVSSLQEPWKTFYDKATQMHMTPTRGCTS